METVADGSAFILVHQIVAYLLLSELDLLLQPAHQVGQFFPHF